MNSTSGYGFLIVAIMLIAGCYAGSRSQDGLYRYEASSDRAFILKQFDHDRFWLVADESKAYDPADTLDTGIHGFVKKPVTFYVYYKDQKPVAFISYYYDTPIFGKIQFVYVDAAYRRQGIAEIMIKDILSRMKKDGIYSVEIVTRLINVGALTLYEKIGFSRLYDNGKYVYLHYVFDK